MKKQLMIFDFVYTGIAAILLLTIAILQNCGINITHENVIGIIVLIILFVLICSVRLMFWDVTIPPQK